jgi:hypothetical protein
MPSIASLSIDGEGDDDDDDGGGGVRFGVRDFVFTGVDLAGVDLLLFDM